MAEEARKEPSMEEILSSIRKIIADDDEPAANAPTEISPGASADPVAEDFETDFGMDDEVVLPTSDSFAALTEAEPLSSETPSPLLTPIPEPVVEPSPAPARRSMISEDSKPMLSAPLADTQTADDAAAYLSKLLDKVEFGEESGADKSIDNLVKELLRPMMKAWLDENLPAVVERHVEAEVARIARMAR